MLYDESHLYACTKLTNYGVPFHVAVRIMQRTVWGVQQCDTCRHYSYQEHDICCVSDCHMCRTCAIAGRYRPRKEKLGLFICTRHSDNFCEYDTCTKTTRMDRCSSHLIICKECNKRFMSKSQLTNHMRSTGPCARAIRDRQATRDAEVPNPYVVTYDCTTCEREISKCACYSNPANRRK